MSNNKGITLSTLVITIVLLTIMSFTIIARTSTTETIDYAVKAEFKTDIMIIKRKLKEKLLVEEKENIPETVSSALGVQGYDDKLKIVDGYLKYITQNEKEQQWLEEFGIKQFEQSSN